MNQYVYRIIPEGHKRSKTICRYGETPPLVVGANVYGPCLGEYNQRLGYFKVLCVDTVRECG